MSEIHVVTAEASPVPGCHIVWRVACVHGYLCKRSLYAVAAPLQSDAAVPHGVDE